MNSNEFSALKRIGVIAALVLVLDQATKYLVLRSLGYSQEKIVIDGFFKFVHWGNTGAAWSLFTGYNGFLAGVSVAALIGLLIFRKHFHADRSVGQIALGLMVGGIAGNLVDRIHVDRQHVIDFLRFFIYRRDGSEIGFPAFNVADSAICGGVILLFYLSLQGERPEAQPNGAELAARTKSQ